MTNEQRERAKKAAEHAYIKLPNGHAAALFRDASLGVGGVPNDVLRAVHAILLWREDH